MCGITGIFAFNLIGKINMINVAAATMALSKRGPDHQDIYNDEAVALGHRRLSIDRRDIANQPMWDESKRFAIVFDGKVLNFHELRRELEAQGVPFRTDSDTEVLLKLYIRHGEACLDRINGFFAFCIYDKQKQTLFVARDRFGIRPLLYLLDEDKFIFASEMNSLIQYGIEKNIDKSALFLYLQLNYVPAPKTIFTGVSKLEPGHCMLVKRGSAEVTKWYTLPYDRLSSEKNSMSFADARNRLYELVETSVKRSLISDVPVGVFLSGGIDSAIVLGLASKQTSDLHTFSVGFRDQKSFDETEYANLVAKHFNTKHTVLSLSNQDMFGYVQAILDHTDEPFADPSAITFYILSKEARKHVTMALSGDGADEIFGGYNKHEAVMRLANPGIAERFSMALAALARLLPRSGNNTLSFAEVARLNDRDRYMLWTTSAKLEEVFALVHPEFRKETHDKDSALLLHDVIRGIPDKANLNDILYADTRLVLPNSILTKVDMTSMAHGLEVRPPFLDSELVNFVFSLPSRYKIANGVRKKILRDTFRDLLPARLYRRPRKGLDVPILTGLKKEMKPLIEEELLSKSFIEKQGIFNIEEIERLKKKLYSSSSGDGHARMWGLVVFQWWWRKYIAARAPGSRSPESGN